MGLYIERYMTFDGHVNELNKKIMGTLMYLNRLSNNFQKKTRLIIVIIWHPEIAHLVGAGWHPYRTKIIPSSRIGAAGVVQRTHEPVEPSLGLTSGGLFVWAPGTS